MRIQALNCYSKTPNYKQAKSEHTYTDPICSYNPLTFKGVDSCILSKTQPIKQFDVKGLKDFLIRHANTVECVLRHYAPNILTCPDTARYPEKFALMLYPDFLEKLKPYGVEAIVHLDHNFYDPPGSYFYKDLQQDGYQKRLDAYHETIPMFKKAGIEVFSTDFDDFTTAKCPEGDAFVKKLKHLFEILGTKNVLMGCHLGRDRTDTAIMLHHCLNPQKRALQDGHNEFHYANDPNWVMNRVKKFYEALTSEQKQYLNLSEPVFPVYENTFKRWW